MRRWFAALGLLLGSLTAHAQSPVWAIRGEQNTIYLAGSVHLLRPDQATLPANLEQAYADAETLIMELDLDDFDPMTAATWMFENGRFQTGTTLRATIGEERYKRLSEEAARLGLDLGPLEQYEPWTIALTLVELQYRKLGFDPEQGIERQLERRARADRKEIQGLETVSEQLGQIDALSYPQQTRFLDITVEEMHNMERDTDELLTAWRNGDTDKLAALLSDEFDHFPELYTALVTDRNKRWVPKIEALLDDQQDYLVVVGALHLVGKDGLIDLMRARGLKPTPVRETK